MGIAEVMYSYVLCILSIALVIVIAYLQIKTKKTNIRQWCMLILTCALISNISVMFQIVNISNEDTLAFYEAFAYIGEAMLPICIFFAIAYYIEPDFKFKNKYLSLFYIPMITILCMFTNNYHGLVFKTYSTNFSECSYGYMFYVYIIDVYIAYIIGFGMLLKYLHKKNSKVWNKIIIGLIAFVLPGIIHILSIIGVFSVKTYITEILQSIMVLEFIYIVFKYQILTELPVSMNTILNTISDAYIVINDKRKIVMYNKIFLDMFDLGKLDIKNMDIKELIEFREFDTIYDDDIQKIISLKNKKNSKKIVFERDSISLDKTLRYEVEILEQKKKETLYLIFITETTEYSKNIQGLKVNHDVILGRERLASLRTNDTGELLIT